MSILLKLTGVKSYMSALVFQVNIQQNEVIRVSEQTAAKLSGLSRPSENDNIQVWYFTLQRSLAAGEKVAYDFTKPEVLELVGKKDYDPDYLKMVASGQTNPQPPVKLEHEEPAPVGGDAPEGGGEDETGGGDDTPPPPAAVKTPAAKRASQRK